MLHFCKASVNILKEVQRVHSAVSLPTKGRASISITLLSIWHFDFDSLMYTYTTCRICLKQRDFQSLNPYPYILGMTQQKYSIIFSIGFSDIYEFWIINFDLVHIIALCRSNAMFTCFKQMRKSRNFIIWKTKVCAYVMTEGLSALSN